MFSDTFLSVPISVLDFPIVCMFSDCLYVVIWSGMVPNGVLMYYHVFLMCAYGCVVSPMVVPYLLLMFSYIAMVVLCFPMFISMSPCCF